MSIKILIIEDDFVSRRLLQTMLSTYGTCDIAVNGIEAVKAFKSAISENRPYNLVCIDIMLPEMDGQEVLKNIREIEEEKGILGLDTTKAIMITALGDYENVKTSFRNQAEAYLVKPIYKEKLLDVLRKLDLIT